MGLFKKIKDIFYDEEIVEVPDNEEKRVELKSRQEPPVIEEITAPIKSVKYDSIDEEDEEETEKFNERELFRPEKTFDFPVFDEEEEEVKPRSKTNVLELQKELEQRSMNTKERIYERKEPTLEKENNSGSTFKPSPVISPVYGILDKNYRKEEIVEKKELDKPYNGDIDYDYVRRKAYGTLEDELEDTLTKVNTNIIDDVDELEKEIDELPKPTKNIQDLLGEIERNKTIGELEEKAKNEMIDEEEEEESKVDDNTLEHDLFNLIDSMYEDKEE